MKIKDQNGNEVNVTSQGQGTIELEDADLRSLRHLLAANLPQTQEQTEKYQVIE